MGFRIKNRLNQFLYLFDKISGLETSNNPQMHTEPPLVTGGFTLFMRPKYLLSVEHNDFIQQC